jgi:glutamate-1-semialdehyde 2,1-aminomutase
MKFTASQDWLAHAQGLIPLGAQTFSKSITQFPPKISPLYCERGLGGKIWDIDGNCFVDLISGLASVTLGYCEPEVNDAVIEQLNKGVTFSLSSKLEAEVAELVCELVPSAEMVRFAKNGSDVTSAAVRLARASTSKEIILTSGYHGWHDWYIGITSMHRGVPKVVSELTDTFEFNNIESFERALKKHGDNVAGVILEPLAAALPKQEFLEHLRSRTRELGIVLVFDEIVTGFRVSPGGAQELLGITPDLTCLGKGIANGFPLSALAGRRDLMTLLERVFFSGTFGGETLSLAAAKVVLNRVKNGSTKVLLNKGAFLRVEVEKLFSELNFQLAKFSGHDSWLFLLWNISDSEELQNVKTLFLQEMINNGVLVLSSHNVMAGHTHEDLLKVCDAYRKTLTIVKSAYEKKNYEELLRDNPIRPLFTVR